MLRVSSLPQQLSEDYCCCLTCFNIREGFWDECWEHTVLYQFVSEVPREEVLRVMKEADVLGFHLRDS